MPPVAGNAFRGHVHALATGALSPVTQVLGASGSSRIRALSLQATPASPVVRLLGRARISVSAGVASTSGPDSLGDELAALADVYPFEPANFDSEYVFVTRRDTIHSSKRCPVGWQAESNYSASTDVTLTALDALTLALVELGLHEALEDIAGDALGRRRVSLKRLRELVGEDSYAEHMFRQRHYSAKLPYACELHDLWPHDNTNNFRAFVELEAYPGVVISLSDICF